MLKSSYVFCCMGVFMEKLAYSLQEFCKLHNLSRTKLYSLFLQGDGPDTMSIGRHRIISVEAAAAWRRKMTERTNKLNSDNVN